VLIIGLISGTSVDAIDAALVEITHSDKTLQLTLHNFLMHPFEGGVQGRVRALMPPHTGSTAAVCETNMLLGEAFAAAAMAVAAQANVPLEKIDLIASHGQTVYHQVVPGAVRSSLQIGAAAVIAERTGCTVVADFRLRDMAVGGEGAPLVPYLDTLLLRDKEKYRAVQNIGGIGNVTYLPPASATNQAVIAFDTGPGNVLMDEAVRLLTGGTQTFDEDGRMSGAGKVDEVLLNQWMQHPFFSLKPPKSTGREQWGPGEAAQYIQQAKQQGLDANDIVATLTAFTARSIAAAYRQYLGQINEVLVSGGGARNPVLLRLLQAELHGSTVLTLDAQGLNPDAKEAVAFALMGYATVHGWPSNVPAATGAAQAVVLGHITPGANYRTLLTQVIQAEVTPPSRMQLVEFNSKNTDG